MAVVESVNVGKPRPSAWKRSRKSTGIGKLPVAGPVEVTPPQGRTSGLAGDFIGDPRHHGGVDQAVYAFQREDLDAWENELGRELPAGFFGENLTTGGLDVNASLIGERWRVGSDLELQVTGPRIPCATFRGWLGEPGWAPMFTRAARPGAYLRVLQAGSVAAGDPIEITHRPDHEVTVALHFRAITAERDLLPALLPARDYLRSETLELIRRRETIALD